MSETTERLYCIHCGRENDPAAAVCTGCGKKLHEKEHRFRDFLLSHIKDDLKNKAGDTFFGAIKGWLLSHLFGCVVSVCIVAAAGTGIAAVTAAPPAGPKPITEAETALFLENNHHQVFPEAEEEFGEVWRPAISEKEMLAGQGTCYGWVAVRDMTLSADTLFHGYMELYVCPGVTVTINGTATVKSGFIDFYVAPGGTLLFTGGIDGGAHLCNDGTTIVTGDYLGGGNSLLVCNRGKLTVTGSFAGDVEVFTFAGAEISGGDRTDNGIHALPFDGADRYEGVTGMNGMFVAVGGLLDGE